jgi:hypothetical protein
MWHMMNPHPSRLALSDRAVNDVLVSWVTYAAWVGYRETCERLVSGHYYD